MQPPVRRPRQGGESGFYVSTDRGESWDRLMAGLPSVLTARVAAD